MLMASSQPRNQQITIQGDGNMEDKLKPGAIVVCPDCGVTFNVKSKTVDALLEKGYEIPKRCYNCRQVRKAKHTPVKQIKCVDCGQLFNFSEFDRDLFARLGYEEPIRCWGCRQTKKKRYDE